MLSNKIRELRLSLNVNQVRLAKDLGVSKQCVSNWENDNVQPSVEMLIRLSRYFNVSCDCLVGNISKRTLDVSELTEDEVAHINLIIKDIMGNKK